MTNIQNHSWQQWLILAVFLVVVIGAGGVIGVATAPGEWYAGLNKPPFNPPNWIFAPVWLALYVAIAVAGWRIWQRAPDSMAMTFWGGQLLLNWLWSPVFFSAHLLWPAFVVIIGVWLAIIGCIISARSIDRLSGWLLVPYLAWVSFATLLNLSIAVLN